MSTATKKVLELCTGESMAKTLWPDAEITSWDYTSPLPEKFFGTFDIVFSNNVLQRSSYHIMISLLTLYSACLNEGGQVHIIVPSLEWAAREVLSEKPSPVSMIMLWGGQGGDNSVHMSGFTMRGLRSYLEKVGLFVTAAKTDQYTLQVNGKDHQTEQHYVCAVKGRMELQRE